MAVKASASITLSFMVDIQAVYRYYKLQSSTATKPGVPTTNPPSGWTDAEPSYTSGSTNTLYFVDLTVFTNGTYLYSAVSKSSAYDAAKEAYNKAVAAQNAVDEMPEYIASRGENLVTNGTGLLGTNYNFAGSIFDASDSYYAGGCFKYTGRLQLVTTEYLPININETYKLSYYMKNSQTSISNYDYLAMYDIDKHEIFAEHVMYIDGSTTTLAQELKNGDTVVYLTSAEGFNTSLTGNHNRGLIFWNYSNASGYKYPVETYSRNVIFPLWDDNSTAIDKTAHTATLKTAWTGGTIPAGTSVSQSSSGGTYSYGNGAFSTPIDEWTKKTATWSGVGIRGAGGAFRDGTAYVRVGWLLNWSGTNASTNTVKISTVELTKNTGISDSKELKEDIQKEIIDSSDEVRQEMVEQNAAVVTSCNEVIISALESYVKTSNYDEFRETVEAALQVMAEQISLNFTTTTERINGIDTELHDKFNTITKYFTFEVDGLTIGQTDSPYKTVIDNDRYTMYVHNVEVLWIDLETREVHTPELTITDRLRMLGYLIEKDSSGNVNWNYIGG